MANPTFEKFNYQVGKLCRMGSRKVKLMAISNRRKQQLRHLGERIYIFKALQQDEDIWEKDEISQLLLTIADLDQEQEMLIDEINEIKAESPPENIEPEGTSAEVPKELETEDTKNDSKDPQPETTQSKPVQEEKKDSTEEKPETSKTKPKAPRKRAVGSKSKSRAAKAEQKNMPQ